MSQVTLFVILARESPHGGSFWTTCVSLYVVCFCVCRARDHKSSSKGVSLQEEKPKVQVSAHLSATNPYTFRPYSPRYQEILRTRLKLPVWEYRNEFLEVLMKNQILVLVGETGSGKTTQVTMPCSMHVLIRCTERYSLTK